MSRRLRLAVFLAGLVGLLLLLRLVGLESLLEGLRRAGWTLVPVTAVYAAVYLCNAAAWHLLLADEPRRPPFLTSWAITTTAFAINYVTPIVNAGGEPYRIAATAPWLGTRRATGATLSYYLLHVISSLALWFAALVAALLVLPRTVWHLSGTILLMAGLLLVLALVLIGHHRGVLEAVLNLLHRVPVLRRLAALLERHRADLAELDRQIRGAWRHPRRFLAALGIDCVGRALAVLEFWLICRGAGSPIGYAEALFIGGLGALALNAFFFVPFEIGSKEGSLVGLFAVLGLPASLGATASLLSRVRELIWIGIGLALVWVTGVRTPGTAREAQPAGRWRGATNPPPRAQPGAEPGP